jgi:RluA family pseudouridine synthase
MNRSLKIPQARVCSVDVAAEKTSMTSSQVQSYLNVAAYRFLELADPESLRPKLRGLASKLRIHGTILLSTEGINLFLAGWETDVEAFLEELKELANINDLTVKRSWTDFQPFRRLLVKVKKEIIAFGIDDIRPGKSTSPKISPEELKRWLDEGRELTLLDTRNRYEIELGTFRNAVDFDLRHFRNFPAAADKTADEDRSQPIVMFCTGGIRCEKAGAYMEKIGYREVYQLDGGILNYFERCGDAHYDGDCFVFDHRVAVKPDLSPSGAMLCFACQATLTAPDIASEKYAIGISCPHCWKSDERKAADCLDEHNDRLAALSKNLPGITPYEHRIPMFVAKRFAGAQLLDWLTEAYPTRSREAWSELCRAGKILTGEHYLTATEIARESNLVREGQSYALVFLEFTEPWVDGRIRVVYEDEWLVVVDKPSSIPTHPSGRYFRHTVEYFLNQVFKPEKLLPAHRVDADTSGLVVFSRRNAVARKIQSAFADRQVEKTYLARVAGHPPGDRFECSAAIGEEKGSGGKRNIDPNGLAAKTQFRVVGRFDNGTSLMEAHPQTGRTHQIRLHLASLGFPILGDRLYGLEGHRVVDECEEANAAGSSLQLHAWRLRFAHPRTGQILIVESPRPTWADDDE